MQWEVRTAASRARRPRPNPLPPPSFAELRNGVNLRTMHSPPPVHPLAAIGAHGAGYLGRLRLRDPVAGGTPSPLPHTHHHHCALQHRRFVACGTSESGRTRIVVTFVGAPAHGEEPVPGWC